MALQERVLPLRWISKLMILQPLIAMASAAEGVAYSAMQITKYG